MNCHTLYSEFHTLVVIHEIGSDLALLVSSGIPSEIPRGILLEIRLVFPPVKIPEGISAGTLHKDCFRNSTGDYSMNFTKDSTNHSSWNPPRFSTNNFTTKSQRIPPGMMSGNLPKISPSPFLDYFKNVFKFLHASYNDLFHILF